MATIISKYIEERYERWLDYSRYHCSLAGMADEEVDVLNEVLCMLLQKDPERLMQMFSAKKGKYTELDFYILQMIKLNITSSTSPYRHKYKSIPKDDNVDWRRLDIIDEEDVSTDHTAVALKQMRMVRYVFDRLELSDLEREVFSFRFFQDNSYSDWPGPEDKKTLYSHYNAVKHTISEILYMLGQIPKMPSANKTFQNNKRVSDLKQSFFKNRTVAVRRFEQ